MDKYNLSNNDIMRELAQRFRTYRRACGMTQQELAQQTGVSIATIRNFERPSATNISLLTLIALLRGIGQLEQMESLLPELPPNPEVIYRQQQKKK